MRGRRSSTWRETKARLTSVRSRVCAGGSSASRECFSVWRNAAVCGFGSGMPSCSRRHQVEDLAAETLVAQQAVHVLESREAPVPVVLPEERRRLRVEGVVEGVGIAVERRFAWLRAGVLRRRIDAEWLGIGHDVEAPGPTRGRERRGRRSSSRRGSTAAADTSRTRPESTRIATHDAIPSAKPVRDREGERHRRHAQESRDRLVELAPLDLERALHHQRAHHHQRRARSPPPAPRRRSARTPAPRRRARPRSPR